MHDEIGVCTEVGCSEPTYDDNALFGLDAK